ncbi:DUF305 domain-containing protein [Acidisphaera sp. S103]|uniref:CopM family metallochaperone n=1 Tax=Acidisphaera sp. S103 TaxID=1747223 RepID=UPI00131AB2EF|nr:DUF305 domain-containing protein [Acidisphaera sp. S103]
MRRRGYWGGRGAAVALFAVLAVASGRSVSADDFGSAMGAAMTRMDQGMRVPATGDPDRDFAAMMIPHHQGAIDMAKVELRFGHDPVLRRLAQGIVVDQQREIVVMRHRLAILPPPPAAPPGAQAHMPMGH